MAEPNVTLQGYRPGSLEEAQALLLEHQLEGRPLVLRKGAWRRWEGCWSPDCLAERFGELPIEGRERSRW